MKKELFVVRVDNYFPELCNLTLPTIKNYAEKIGAKFTVISERKYPDYPPAYEKVQIYDLGTDNDFNILVDCDLVFDEAMYDVTELVSENSVGSWMEYDPHLTIAFDEYIKLDGSDRIPATNFMVSTKDTHKIWEPFEIELVSIINNMKRSWVIDEYCVGHNMKKYDIKNKGIIVPGAENNLFMHANIETDNKDLKTALTEIEDFLSQ